MSFFEASSFVIFLFATMERGPERLNRWSQRVPSNQEPLSSLMLKDTPEMFSVVNGGQRGKKKKSLKKLRQSWLHQGWSTQNFEKTKLSRLLRGTETLFFNQQRWQNYRREREEVKKKGVSRCCPGDESSWNQTRVKCLPWEGSGVNQQVNTCELFIVFNSIVYAILVGYLMLWLWFQECVMFHHPLTGSSGLL